MSEYVKLQKPKSFPRLPLAGALELTYRCNNNCRHCWVSIEPNAEEEKEELSGQDFKTIINEARQMGCHSWAISGGEPMLRSDFSEIFDYITSHSTSYTLNTNGTLITPQIAQLMKRKGGKMIALYGATAEVHDYITRNPGSFAATMRGLAYLKEAGAGFTIQLIPMRDNYHQFQQMRNLAQSLSPHYRVGRAWLYLSACGDPERNKEIIEQRLSPKQVVELDQPDLSFQDWLDREHDRYGDDFTQEEYLFASCIARRRSFHIDPYAKMSFCCFIKDPSLRYDLKKGSLKECWEKFIPSLAKRIRVEREYLASCGGCKLHSDCRCCPVYSYLEHRRFPAKVEYLCAVARESRKFKQIWKKEHRRYYRIAGITIQVESDLPITENTFHPKFRHFATDGPGEHTVTIRHHFSLPDLNGKDLGRQLYRRPPWAIYKKGDSWIYLGISSAAGEKSLHRLAVFNYDHTRARIYSDKKEDFLKGNLQTLTLLPTDQILLAQVLADRGGCYLHSSGVSLDGQGLLFVGHSDAGKSTIVKLFQDRAKILCDERMIVRRVPEGFKIYGTWSHGEVPEVSSDCAPLRAVLFPNKAQENQLELLKDKAEINKRLLACLIRPFVTTQWWQKMLLFMEKISAEVPCYLLYFDESGRIAQLFERL